MTFELIFNINCKVKYTKKDRSVNIGLLCLGLLFNSFFCSSRDQDKCFLQNRKKVKKKKHRKIITCC